MNERKRIFDLVKQGVISTEEALVLLENITKETGQQTFRPDVSKATISEKEWFQNPSLNTEEEEIVENEFENLTDQLSEILSELDVVNAKISDLNEEYEVLNTQVNQEGFSEEETYEKQTNNLTQQHQIADELAQLIECKEQLENRLEQLTAKDDSKIGMADSEFKIPDDWKEQAGETFSQVGDKLTEVSNQLGRFLKKSFKNISKTVEENVEWKSVNIKVPGLAVASVEHVFNYEDYQPTILDFKVAHGKVEFKTWPQDHIQILAKMKIYGKFDEADPLSAILARTDTAVNQDRLYFYLANKRVKADLEVFLPSKNYDHVSVKMLNGRLNFEQIQGKDFYLKLTNGDIKLNAFEATMLEIEGTNGNIEVTNSLLADTIIETVNGNVTMDTTPLASKINLINGTIRLSYRNDKLEKLNASTVNGDIKLSLPKNLGMEICAKSTFGNIQSRLTNVELLNEKNEKMNHVLELRKIEEKMATIQLSSNTGTIYLKNND